MNDRASTQAGYSPDISAELLIHGERLNVAAFGPRGFVLRSAKFLPPGEGTIRMQVDGRQTIYRVQFPEGIDPSRNRQPYRLNKTSESEEAAA
jgi:hypothetical protein